jgi:hypothetical protein
MDNHLFTMDAEAADSVTQGELPIKNTFIHFDEHKMSSARGRFLRRCSTDPTDQCLSIPSARQIQLHLSEPKLEEEDEDEARSPSPYRSIVNTSTSACSTRTSSPGGGISTPETPNRALPWLQASPPSWTFCSPEQTTYTPTPSLPLTPSAQQAEVAFTFTLRRAPEFELGLDWILGRNGEVIVQNIMIGSALDSWNNFQGKPGSLDRSLLPGDMVVSVNNQSDVDMIIEECKTKFLLKFRVVRRGVSP